jgi:hypothetical protein
MQSSTPALNPRDCTNIFRGDAHDHVARRLLDLQFDGGTLPPESTHDVPLRRLQSLLFTFHAWTAYNSAFILATPECGVHRADGVRPRIEAPRGARLGLRTQA